MDNHNHTANTIMGALSPCANVNDSLDLLATNNAYRRRVCLQAVIPQEEFAGIAHATNGRPQHEGRRHGGSKKQWTRHLCARCTWKSNRCAKHMPPALEHERRQILSAERHGNGDGRRGHNAMDMVFRFRQLRSARAAYVSGGVGLNFSDHEVIERAE